MFSYHVLEHVYDLNAVVRDMARLVRAGGTLCIIFPCGNVGSFEEKTMRLIKGGKVLTETGETVFFYEQSAGHLRQMQSWQIFELFAEQHVCLRRQYYANQFFGAVDYITGSTDSGYIRKFFATRRAYSPLARLNLRIHQLVFLVLGWLIRLGHKPSASPLHSLGKGVEVLVEALALKEWYSRRSDPTGSAQFLLFEKF